MDSTHTTRLAERDEDTPTGRSRSSGKHHVTRPGRRSVLFGGSAILAGLAATGASLIATVKPAGAVNPNGYQILGFTRQEGRPCNEKTGYARHHDCSPGCGPSMVLSGACNTSGKWVGYHRGGVDTWTVIGYVAWKLRPNACYGGNYDGWKWATASDCKPCRNMFWRCHDGFVSSSSGTYNSICRKCVRSGNRE